VGIEFCHAEFRANGPLINRLYGKEKPPGIESGFFECISPKMINKGK